MSIKEGSLGAPIRHPIDWENPNFLNEKLIDDELRRVFDICHGCRRCFNLCESFPKLFDLIDESKTGELDSVSSDSFKDVVDACTLCDMCFLTKCPYVPPHEFNIDFPHLMLRYRALERGKNNHNKIDDQLTKTDRNGKFFSKFSNLTNWSTKTTNKITRPIMELFLKIDKEAELPKFYNKTLMDKISKKENKVQIIDAKQKVAIFPTCFVNYNNPELGLSAKRILDKLNIENKFVYDGCCGMPQLEGGNIKSVTNKAIQTSRKLKKLIADGYTIITLVPSCSLMFKFEWPLLVPKNDDVKLLSLNTKDICEFLVDQFKDDNSRKLLNPVQEDNNVSLHISCHSRAQNIGQKATELLKLVPGLNLDVIERCSGHGGSWGIKKDNFDMALKVGKPVARKAIQNENKVLISECPLAGAHIKQGMDKIKKNEVKVLSHPLEIIEMSINI